MIKIQDTKNMIGITIHGDYEDLKALHHAISDYLRFYFDHQKEQGAYSCYETILGLCYDIRHAYQGDRNIEAVDNNHENIAMLASCIYQLDEKALKKERKKYGNGNLYFNVEVLYPWAVYYLYTLQAITEDTYQHNWFENDEFGYTEYQAEKDIALIQYFVHLLWEKLRDNLPEEVMQVIWNYTRIYNHIEYYFGYPDLYMMWFCRYWINGSCTKQQRLNLLPLLCLELSSILDEDPDEQEEIIELAEQKSPHNADNLHTFEISDDSKDTSVKEQDEFEKKIQLFQASIAQTTLRGLDLFDNYAQTFYNNKIPYQSMDDFMDTVYDYVEDHGLFSEESFEKWLNLQLGEVDWDELEW